MSKLDKSLPRVPCSSYELDELTKKAKSGGISKAQFIRNAIFLTEIKEVDKESEKRKLFLLNNIANNINQIAKKTNIKRKVDKEVLEALENNYQSIRDVIEIISDGDFKW
jgi:hypothetical protein